MRGPALACLSLLVVSCRSDPNQPSQDPVPASGGTVSVEGMGGLGGLGGGAAQPPHLIDRPTAYEWDLPQAFPTPWEPADNPTTEEKVELGRHLFYDTRLSSTGETSCASCHRQELAFTDGRARALGSTGELHPRSSMSLANVGYAATLTWAHPFLYELERQVLVPLFGDDPIEHGLGEAADLEEALLEEPAYERLFERAFPDAKQLGTLHQAALALGAFQRTLISGTSPYDAWLNGDVDAISPAARRGYALFHSEKLECFHCHSGFNFTDHVHFADKAFFETPFHNTGLYNIDGQGAYPEPNTGTMSVTLDPRDMGQFKAPTLRNIAVTAPYMHDGSIATLSEVLDHYAAGGRTLEGDGAGNGSLNPLKDPLLVGFTLSDDERADVVAFLESLTDERFLTNPAHANPWK